MKLGEVVKKFRTEHAMSMEDFAKRCGLSKGYISMLEANQNPKTKKPLVPSMATMQSIAEAIGITTQDLIDILDDSQPVEIKDRVAAHFKDDIDISELSDADKKAVRTLVDALKEKYKK